MELINICIYDIGGNPINLDIPIKGYNMNNITYLNIIKKLITNKINYKYFILFADEEQIINTIDSTFKIKMIQNKDIILNNIDFNEKTIFQIIYILYENENDVKFLDYLINSYFISYYFEDSEGITIFEHLIQLYMNCSYTIKNNIEIIKSLILTNCSHVISYINHNNDKNLILLALNNYSNTTISNNILSYGDILQHVSTELSNDIDIVQKSVNIFPLSLQYASIDLRNDFELCKMAVINNGMALEYVSYNLRDNYELVMIAVQTSLNFNKNLDLNDIDIHIISPLQFSSLRLKDDKNIVMESIISLANVMNCTNNKEWCEDSPLLFASDRLKDDSDFIDIVLNIHPQSIKYISNRLKYKKNRDSTFIINSIDKFPNIYKHVYNKLLYNRIFFINYTSKNADILEFAPFIFKNDFYIVFNIVRSNGLMLKHATAKLQNNIDIVKEAFINNPLSICYASTILKKNNIFITEIQNIFFCNKFSLYKYNIWDEIIICLQ